jgi:hypothetical protein
MVYGDRIAWILWEKPRRAIIIRNPSPAETYRKQFLFMWEIAEPFRTENRRMT